MCAIDDGEPFTLAKHAIRKARKPRPCGECCREIRKGETYEIVRGLSDGYWDTYATCAHCIAARSWLQVVCHGYCLGGVREDLSTHWGEDSSYPSWWLGRAIVGMRRQWKRKDGTLMRVLPVYAEPKAAA